MVTQSGVFKVMQIKTKLSMMISYQLIELFFE